MREEEMLEKVNLLWLELSDLYNLLLSKTHLWCESFFELKFVPALLAAKRPTFPVKISQIFQTDTLTWEETQNKTVFCVYECILSYCNCQILYFKLKTSVKNYENKSQYSEQYCFSSTFILTDDILDVFLEN